MTTKRKSKNLCFTVCDVILWFLILLVSLKYAAADGGGMSNDNQKILSRRRRYLTFPEGSSFQVVYETYHPIPGYGNLLIFYQTQALAWELPSQAYHPEEHLQDLWDDAVFPNDQYDELAVNNQIEIAAAINAQNAIQEKNSADRSSQVNAPPYVQPPSSNQNQTQGVQLQNRNGEQPFSGNNYYSNSYSPSVPNRNYYSNNKSPQRVSDMIGPLTKTISNKMDYYLSYADKVLSQVKDFATENHEPWKKADWTTYTLRNPTNDYERSEANSRNYAFAQSRNFIHPAFGKRSTDKNLTPEEKFNMNYHRTSRQTLYQKIAKFLDTDEINGAQCVLKALCETGKRRDAEKKPGPFLMEILRVVFSLPEADRNEDHPVYSQYDNAHAASKDCDELFPKCKSSLWNKDAIL